MNLLLGVVLSTVFLASSCCVAFANGVRAASLSVTFEDPDTLEGKLFMVALIVPAVCLWTSGYHYKLSNVRIMGPDGQKADWWCRFFRILGNICFIIVAIVPHLDQDSMVSRLHVSAPIMKIPLNFELTHFLAGNLAFILFFGAELLVLIKNVTLSAREVWWRSLGISVMAAAMLLFTTAELVTYAGMGNKSRVAQSWSFRFEILIGSGLSWSNQLIWAFSGKSEVGYTHLFPWSHLVALTIVSMDFNRCGMTDFRNGIALGQLIIFVAITRITWATILGFCNKVSLPSDREAQYGACAVATSAQA